VPAATRGMPGELNKVQSIASKFDRQVVSATPHLRHCGVSPCALMSAELMSCACLRVYVFACLHVCVYVGARAQAPVAGGNAADSAKDPGKSSAELGPDETSSLFEVEIVRGNQPGPDGQTGVGIHYARTLAADGSVQKTAPFIITGFVSGSPSALLSKDRPDLLRIGQRLHSVDGTSLTGLSTGQVRSLILGEPGSRYHKYHRPPVCHDGL